MKRRTLGDAIVALAATQYGIREDTGNNDGIPAQRYAGGRQEPWCAHFVAWVYRECGAPLPGDVEPAAMRPNPIALVATLEAEANRAGWFIPSVQMPQPGDVVLYVGRAGSDAVNKTKVQQRHCGIVVAVDREAIHTIEGNLGDGVKKRMMARTDARIAGYVRHPRASEVVE